MKVGLVLAKPPGNSETFFRNKITALQKQGIQVQLFVDRPEKKFNLCKQYSLPGNNRLIQAWNLFTTLLISPLRSFRFLRLESRDRTKISDIFRNFLINSHLLKTSGIDWIHFGFATMAVGRENIAKAMHSKMAISLRGFDISRYPLRHPGVYRLTWKKTDKIHTISNALLQKAHSAGLPIDSGFTKITPAIDTAMFPGSKIREFENPVRLLTVARLHWSKGLEYTIQALSILHKKGINFVYTIAGDGNDFERLVLAAHQLGIRDKVVFAGYEEHADLPARYGNCDIYLQYSVQEGFCNAVLEAQAMGLLCIVSDAEGLPENVLHEKTGWVVPRRSPELLAEQIIKVTKSESSFLNSVRNNARSRVLESFNLEKQALEFVNFYSEIK